MIHIRRIDEYYRDNDANNSIVADIHRTLNRYLQSLSWKMPENSKLYYDEKKTARKYEYNFFTCNAEEITKGKGKGKCFTDEGLFEDSRDSSLVAYYPLDKTIYVILHIKSVCGKSIKDKNGIRTTTERWGEQFLKFIKNTIKDMKSNVFNGSEWDIDKLVRDDSQGEFIIDIPLCAKNIKDYNAHNFPEDTEYNNFVKNAYDLVEKFASDMKDYIKRYFNTIG